VGSEVGFKGVEPPVSDPMFDLQTSHREMGIFQNAIGFFGISDMIESY